MVREVVALLTAHEIPDAVYLDCTLGLGGHTEALLIGTGSETMVVGCDRDAEAIAMATEHLAGYGARVRFSHSAFSELSNVIDGLRPKVIAGALFDLGVSSMQLDTPERGFSFQYPGPLDMRMDRSTSETAADWLNRQSESDLSDALRKYGDERWSLRIARAIVRHRKERGPLRQCEELEALIWRTVPREARHGRIHPATRTFQAIRMAVNNEIEQLRVGLETVIAGLTCKGRIVAISFHSVEDRCVKQTFRSHVKASQSDRKFALLGSKPLYPSREEVACNRRARSAKLRVLERVA